MERKLLFFDIDGTLLPEVDGQIPESTIEAVRTAREMGHYIFINTGRAWSMLPKQLQELNVDGYLCGCGTYITLHDKVLVNKEFDKDRCMDVVMHARKLNVSIIAEGNRACYYDSKGAPNPWFVLSGGEESEDALSIITDLNTAEDFQFSKFCIIANSKEELHTMLEPFSDYFEPIDRGDLFYEIVPIGYSKATAIDTILEHLGQRLEDCYVFGDSSNDLSMLNHVPNSIAMGNSSPEVLKAASYITAPVWRDGIYVALKHFGLI